MWSLPGYCFIAQGTFPVEFCQQTQDIYGIGYGVRGSVFEIGFNGYEGPTRSMLAHEPPFQTRVNSSFCSYGRGYYNNYEGMHIVTAAIRQAAQAILMFAKETNVNVTKTLGLGTGYTYF